MNYKLCEEHNLPMKLYCYKCDKIMCDKCYILKDREHDSLPINKSILISKMKEADSELEKLDKLIPKFKEKKDELIPKIEQHTNKKIEEFTKIINEKRDQLSQTLENVKNDKIEEFENIAKNIYKIYGELEKLIKSQYNNNEDKKKYLNTQFDEYVKQREKFKTKYQNQDNFFSHFIPCTLIPPLIEVNNLLFKLNGNENDPDKFYCSFVHMNVKWKFYLSKKNNYFSLCFQVENLKKNETQARVFMEIFNHYDNGKNIKVFDIPTIINSKNSSDDNFTRLNINLKSNELLNFMDKSTKTIKANFKFQYLSFDAFVDINI